MNIFILGGIQNKVLWNFGTVKNNEINQKKIEKKD